MRSPAMSVASIALSIAFGCGGGTTPASRRMADGKQWTTANLNVNTSPSYCYDDAETNCRRYGRLYTWESARRGCQSLGDGWRLPTDEEWRKMAKHYGGLGNDAAERGERRTQRSCSEARQASMPCSVATAPLTDSTHGLRLTVSTGQHRKMIRPVPVQQLWQRQSGSLSTERGREADGNFRALCQGVSIRTKLAARKTPRRKPGESAT